MQGGDDLPDLGTGEGVVDVLAVTARLHQIVRAQPRELLGNGRLAQPERLLDLGDRPLQTEDDEPRFVRQRLQEFARPPRIGEEHVQIHVVGRRGFPLRNRSRRHGVMLHLPQIARQHTLA
jgi:hypothetical protein